MNGILKTFWRFKWLILIIILIAIVFSSIGFPTTRPTVSAKVELIKNETFVISTGNIEARNDALLSFEQSGSVKGVFVAPGDEVGEGDLIATVDDSKLRAEVEAQRSSLERQKILLDSFVTGPEELERKSLEANIELSRQKLENQLDIAFAETQSSSAKIENVVRTRIDTLFDNAPYNPIFTGDVSVVDAQKINQLREDLEKILTKWRNTTTYSTENDVVLYLKEYKNDLTTISAALTTIYDKLNPSRDQNATIILLADIRENILNEIVQTTRHLNGITSTIAEYNLTKAQSEKTLAGGTTSERLAQSAQIGQERERLNQLIINLSKAELRAPFDGIVGEVSVDIGEFLPAGQSIVRFISKDGFDLSVAITELEVNHINVGDVMKARVEALDDAEIDVKVRTINSTEGKINNVPVYTVVFDVITENADIRSGMTVDVEIEIGTGEFVKAVPKGAVGFEDGNSFVEVERDGEIVKVVVISKPIQGDKIAIEGEVKENETIIYDAIYEAKRL